MHSFRGSRFLVVVKLTSLAKGRHTDTAVEEVVQRLGASVRCFEECWLIESQLSASQIKNEIEPLLDDHDRLLITELGSDYDSVGLGNPANSWLSQTIGHF